MIGGMVLFWLVVAMYFAVNLVIAIRDAVRWHLERRASTGIPTARMVNEYRPMVRDERFDHAVKVLREMYRVRVNALSFAGQTRTFPTMTSADLVDAVPRLPIPGDGVVRLG